MASVLFYVATSLDGFIADDEGSIEWMAPYDARLYGYDKFYANVGALIMGRRTFELIHATADVWPYEGKTVYVLSSRKLDRVPAGVITSTRGMRAAAQSARDGTKKDIWVVGGATTMQSAIDEGVVDLVEIFLVPILLGRGLTLLNDLRQRQTLIFDGIEAFADGVVSSAIWCPRDSERRG